MKDFYKTDMIGKTIAQSLPFIAGFIIVYFAVEFLGVGDWVRKNSIWFITFIVVMVGILINNLARYIIDVLEYKTDADKDLLLEKLKDLDLDIDYIKNTIRALKANGE